MNRRIAIYSLLVIACGDGGIAFEDLSVEGTRQICEGLVACGEYPDQATCSNSIAVFADLDRLTGDIENGNVRYDSGAADDCLDAYDEFADCELKPASVLDELSDTCARVFVGSVAIGDPCNETVQCAGDAFCVRQCTEQCCAGTCVEIPLAATAEEGEPCGDGIDCIESTFCSSNNQCVARPGPGESCANLSACAAGSVCNIDLFGNEPGTCVELKGEGEACDPTILFPDQRCLRFDNYCDKSDNTCKPRLSVGENCNEQSCVAYAVCIEGTCQALPKAGEACNPQGTTACLPSLQCIEGVCALPEGLYCPLEESNAS